MQNLDLDIMELENFEALGWGDDFWKGFGDGVKAVAAGIGAVAGIVAT